MNLAIIGNVYHDTITEIVPAWLEWLSERAKLIVADDLAGRLNLSPQKYRTMSRTLACKNCDMIVSLGGDGTILSTARIVKSSGIPILGIKFGGLGFLVEVGQDEIYEAMTSILEGGFVLQQQMVLEAVIPSRENHEPFYAMNDIVIDKGAQARLVKLRTHVHDEFLNSYIADGLIIATPTGSTAYSLAAGGPILPPEMNAMVITPICPHSFSGRPVVIPDEKIVSVELTSAQYEANLSADGQVSELIQPGTKVQVRKADFHIKLVRRKQPHSSGFYDRLRHKLHWGADYRERGN